MSETEISKEPADLPKVPAATPSTTPAPARRRGLMAKLGLVVLSLAAGAVGAWAVLATGLVKPDATSTITANRETLVLQQGEIVAEVFKRVNPSTVTITSQSVDTTNRFYGPQVSQGSGSGVIITADGLVMTNKHVIPEGSSNVTVITSDGKQYTDVKVLGRDPTNDIAFVKINNVDKLTPATLGNSSAVEPGQQVVAIGNPLGLFRNSVTSGIISGIGRPVIAGDETGTSAEQLEDMLQTDAAINPGNSGGPLVNLKGEVIGINTAVSTEGNAIAFAIPVNTTKGMIESISKEGKINKAYLGVRYVSIDEDVATQLKLPVKTGALLRSNSGQNATVAGGPADKAGLREGDIIFKINNTLIQPGSGLVTQLSQFKPGDTVELTVLRGGKEQAVKVTLGTFPTQ